MAGDLVATGLEIENTIKEPHTRNIGASGLTRSNFVYCRSETSATDGYTSTTTSTELVALNVKGMNYCTFVFDNRDDEDIDGGGANNKDLDVIVNVSSDPAFGATSYQLDSVTLGEGTTQTWRLGPTEMDFAFIQFMVDAETEDSPLFFDFYFYARVG